MDIISEKSLVERYLFIFYGTLHTFFSNKFIPYNIIRRGPPSVSVSSRSGWLAHRDKTSLGWRGSYSRIELRPALQ
jgi:hypothetical protein